MAVIAARRLQRQGVRKAANFAFPSTVDICKRDHAEMTILFVVVRDGAHDAVPVHAQLWIIEEGAGDRAEQLGLAGLKAVTLESTARVFGDMSVNKIIHVPAGSVEAGGRGGQCAVDPYLFRRGFREENVAGARVGEQ